PGAVRRFGRWHSAVCPDMYHPVTTTRVSRPIDEFLEGPSAAAEAWPALDLASWRETYATLHLWTQIVGKTRLALAAPVNHWWHVALQVTPCGLSTSAIPWEGGGFDVEFDFR